MKIIDHTHPVYREKWKRLKATRYNGAFYYSKEIVKYIIPNVKTHRNWITLNIPGAGISHAIVFIHNNLHPDHYDWLNQYSDLVLVCGLEETCEKVAHLGTPIYLPLSVDVKYVEQFKIDPSEKRGTAYVGRASKIKLANIDLPFNIDVLSGMRREQLLPKVARYEKVYAVGRSAIEARILGCEILPYDKRFPDPSIWKVVDSLEAAKMLQEKLDEIDKISE